MLFGIYIYNLPKMEGEGEERDRVMTMTEKPKRREVGGGNKRRGGEKEREFDVTRYTHGK